MKEHSINLTAGDDDRLWGLTVSSVGYRSVKPGEPYAFPGKGRAPGEYLLLYIVGGRGIFSSEATGREKEIPVGEGQMLLLFPGIEYNCRPLPGSGWDEYRIGFQGGTVDSHVANGFFSPQKPVLTVGADSEIEELYRRTADIAAQQKAGYQQVLAGIASLILGLAYSACLNNRFGNAEDCINRAKALISEEFRDIKPQDIARRLDMSYSAFRKIFRQYTGFAPMQYILDVKIGKSKELLTDTDLPVREIARRMGFDSQEYFSTSFRRSSGTTPLHYRKTAQGRRNADK